MLNVLELKNILEFNSAQYFEILVHFYYISLEISINYKIFFIIFYPSETQQRSSASFAYDFVKTSTLSATIKAL